MLCFALLKISIVTLEYVATVSLVKRRVDRVEVLGIKLILRDAESVADFTLSNRSGFCLVWKRLCALLSSLIISPF